jgi:hypothetical protein
MTNGRVEGLGFSVEGGVKAKFGQGVKTGMTNDQVPMTNGKQSSGVLATARRRKVSSERWLVIGIWSLVFHSAAGCQRKIARC